MPPPNVNDLQQGAAGQAGYTFSTDVNAPMSGGGIYPPQAATMPTSVTNLGDVSKMLQDLVTQQASYRGNIILPQPLPPQKMQAGDVSGMYVRSDTIGGPKHNARVALAGAIGQGVAGIVNRHEEKKARDIAFDVQRLQDILNNPTPSNQKLYNEIMFKDPNNPDAGLSKRGKEIQAALNFPIPGVEDKRKSYQKKAGQLILQSPEQQQSQRTTLDQQTAAANTVPGTPQMNIGGAQIPGAPSRVMTPPGAQTPGGGAIAGGPQAAAAAVQKAQAPWEPSGAYAQMLGRFPQTYQISPQQQLEVQMIQLGMRPNAGQLLDTMRYKAQYDVEFQRAVMRFDAQNYATDMAALRGQNRDAAMLAATRILAKSREYAARQGVVAAGVRATATEHSADVKAGADYFKTVVGAEAKELQSRIAKDTDTIANKTGEFTSKQIKAAQADLEDARRAAQALQETSKSLMKRYESGLGSTGGTGGTAGAGTTTPAPGATPASDTSGLSAEDAAFTNWVTSQFPETKIPAPPAEDENRQYAPE